MSFTQVGVLASHKIAHVGIGTLVKKAPALRLDSRELDSQNWFKQLNRSSPPVLLIDLSDPSGEMLELCRKINAQFKDIALIGLIDLFYTQQSIRWSEMGIRALLLKNTTPKEIELAVRAIRAEGYYCSTQTAPLLAREVLLKQLSNDREERRPIAEKEVEVLRLLCEDQSNLDIAEELYISHRTVEGYKRRIKQKLGTRSMVGAAVKAIKNGWLSV